MKSYQPYSPRRAYLVSSVPTELRANSGWVLGVNAVRITFSKCVDITAETGIQVNIADGGWEEVAAIASGSQKTWVFTTTTAIAENDIVQWQYLGGEDSIVDCVDAIDVGPLGPKVVTNDLELTAPTLVSAEVGTVANNKFVLTLSEGVPANNVGPGWSVKAEGVALTIITYSLYQPSVIRLTTAETVYAGQEVTVSYDSGPGNIVDLSGYPTANALASITDAPVTNNSTAAGVFSQDDLTDGDINFLGTFARDLAVYHAQPDLSLVSIPAKVPIFSGARWTGTAWSLLDGVGDPLPGPFGLLMEPAFTQLARNSEDASAWTQTGTTVATNAVTAPNGALTGDTLTATATSTPRISRVQAVPESAWVFLSTYVKAGTAPFLLIRARQKDAVTHMAAWFNLSSGAVATVQSGIVNATITPAADGWYRASISFPAGLGANTVLFQLALAGADDSLAGVIGHTMSVWGIMSGVIGVETNIPSYFACGAADTARPKDALAYSGVTAPNSYDLVTDAGTTVLTDWNGTIPDATEPTTVYSVAPTTEVPAVQKYTVHHYVSVEANVSTATIEANCLYPGIVGFQKRYPWKILENVQGVYTFDAIATDLAWAAANNMQMIAMIEDKGFTPTDYVVPSYLEAYASINNKGGLTMNRWQAFPQERLIALTAALGAAFNAHPNFEGLSFQETALSIDLPVLAATDYTEEAFRDSMIETMIAAKNNLPQSNVFFYQNFLADLAAPFVGQGYLEDVGLAVGALGVQVGGPDILPTTMPDQGTALVLQNYPHYAVWDAAGVKLFCSAQNDSYRCPVPDLTDVYYTPEQIRDFARDTLKVNIILWNYVTFRSFPTSYKFTDAVPVFASDWES